MVAAEIIEDDLAVVVLEVQITAAAGQREGAEQTEEDEPWEAKGEDVSRQRRARVLAFAADDVQVRDEVELAVGLRAGTDPR